MEANDLERRCDSEEEESAVVDCPFPRQVLKPVAVPDGAVLWAEFQFGDGVGEGLLVRALLCGWWERRLGHLVVWLLWAFRFL